MYGGYGGGYGMGMGMGMMGGMMNPMMGQMGWLGAMHQTVGSLGQMSELLGMNMEAIQFALGSFGQFLERIGGATHEVIGFFTGAPPLPQIDPQTGQPLPLPPPEEIQAERKKKLVRWFIGVIVLYFGYRGIKYLIKRMSGNKTPNENMLSQQWDSLAQQQQQQQQQQQMMGVNPMMMGMNGMYGNSMYGANSLYGSPYNTYGTNPYNSYGTSTYGSPYGMYNNNRMYGTANASPYTTNELDDIFG